MTAASRLLGPASALAVALLLGLCGCTGGPEPDRPGGTPVVPAPTTRTVSRPPLPSSSAPTRLPSSAPVQLAPVSSAPDDLGRIDIRDGSPRTKRVTVTLPAGSGYTVTAGCTGKAGTLLRYRVVGTSEPDSGFLFGSTTPCNGRFVTDAALANIGERTPARLEVALDAGVDAATVVLRRAPTDAHL